MIEVHEAVDVVGVFGIHILPHEAVGREVNDGHLRIGLFCFGTNGLNKVCFANARSTIDEEGVEDRLARGIGYSLGNGGCHFVTLSDDVGLKSVGLVELRVGQWRTKGNGLIWVGHYGGGVVATRQLAAHGLAVHLLIFACEPIGVTQTSVWTNGGAQSLS